MPNPKREDRAYWTELWFNARSNMPRRKGDHRGSPLVLRMLLGYTYRDQHHRNSASQHFHTASSRGDKPKDENRAELLRMLAGPYGTVIARALASKRGLNLSKYPKWP